MGNYRMGFGGDNDRISAARDPRDGDSNSDDDGDHGMGSAGSQRRDLGRQSNVEMEDSLFDDRDHDRENEDPRDHYDQQHRTTYGGPTVRNIGNQRVGRAASTGRRSGYLSDDTDIEEEMMRIDPVDLEWRRQLHEGDPIDAQNLFGNWCPAMVLRILDGEVRVRYLNMNDSWQRWLPVDSGQLAPPATKTRNDSAPLRLAQIVEVRKPGTSIWKEAHVVKARPSDLLVRYAGRQQQFDDWMPFMPENVAASGDHVRLRSAFSEQRRLSVKPNINRNRVIQAQNPRFQHYRDALAAQGLRIHSVEGDGNCLFRAVSHQVYGDDRHHELVRGYCMDYMESEKEYFEPYVVGDMSAFLRYLQHKRRNGVWGDDPEIQAMCELYDRPAEVYAYDPTSGFRKLRTFHENSALSRNRPPICLSYYGGGHYDSIVGPQHASNVIREPPGQWEQHHLEISRRINTREGGDGGSDEQVGAGAISAQRVPAAATSGAATTTTEMDQLERILLMSRNEFDAMRSNLDDTLKQAIAESEVTAVSSEQRAVDEATRESEIAAIQAELLEKARQASEEEQMRKALEASVKEQNIPHHALDYDDDVSAAIAASLVEHSSLVPPGGMDTFTPVDEEEEMRRILELSAKEYEASSRSFESTITSESAATSHLDYAFHDDVPGLVDADEMDELQRAIQASLSES